MAKIRLYRNCEILEEKNFAVDDVETYLASLTPVKEFNNTQYIKIGLDIEITVVLDQTYLDKQWTNNFNYCAIEMDNGGDDNTYYYFIREKRWTSKDAIKLELHMDVVNTYKEAIKLTNKTTIQRMHKDRFVHTTPKSTRYDIWLDDQGAWVWGQTAAGFEGVADLLIEDLKGVESVSWVFDFDMVQQPTYAYSWDAESGRLTVSVLAPTPGVIPQELLTIYGTEIITKLKRNIDFQSEGIEAPLFINPSISEDETRIVERDENDESKHESYYLIYKTNNNFDSSKPDDFVYNNVINIFLTSDNGLKFRINSDIEILPGNLATKKDLFFCFPTGADGKKLPNSFANDFPSIYNGLKIYVEATRLDNTVDKFELKVEPGTTQKKRLRSTNIRIYKNVSGNIKIAYAKLKTDNFEELEVIYPSEYKRIVFKNLGKVKGFKTTRAHTENTDAQVNWYQLLVREGDGSSEFVATITTEEKTTKPFKPTNYSDINNTVDTTDIKLIKIIKLPYLPATFADSSFGAIWNAGESMIQLNAKVLKEYLHNNLDLYNDNDDHVEILDKYFIDIPTITPNTTRNNDLESKILHSDFYVKKFVYDSFSYNFNLEEWEVYNDYTSFFTPDFITTNTASSAFLFDFTNALPGKHTKSNRDFANIMIVNRNLEVPIWNNYYLQYLRNGVNYDVKSKQAQSIASGIGTGVGIASTVAGIALSATGYGSTFGTPMIVGGIASTATSLTSAISSSVQADRTLQQKLEQAKNQGATVQGADDIGLLSYYVSFNKPKLIEYSVSQITKERIIDLFFYCGYKCDYQGIPDISSRYWFNYIQCEPVFAEDSRTAKMSKNIKDELVNKYKQGITYLHHHSGYDFAQTKENWENWLIN